MCKARYELNRPGFRTCITCKEEKPLTKEYYYSDKNRAQGFMYRCRLCDRKRVDGRIDRYKNMTVEQKKRARQRNKEYCQRPFGRAMINHKAYRRIDKERGHETTITRDDLLKCFDELCSYCGAPATGFDRIDNSIGHTKENCIPACIVCNTARMDNFTHEEMLIIGDTIRLIRAKREYEEFGNCVL